MSDIIAENKELVRELLSARPKGGQGATTVNMDVNRFFRLSKETKETYESLPTPAKVIIKEQGIRSALNLIFESTHSAVDAPTIFFYGEHGDIICTYKHEHDTALIPGIVKAMVSLIKPVAFALVTEAWVGNGPTRPSEDPQRSEALVISIESGFMDNPAFLMAKIERLDGENSPGVLHPGMVYTSNETIPPEATVNGRLVGMWPQGFTTEASASTH